MSDISDPQSLSLPYMPPVAMVNGMAYNNAVDEFRDDEYPMMKGESNSFTTYREETELTRGWQGKPT